MTEFDPKIIVFACRWCSYAGADLAGVSRLQYPSNIRIIRTMCSGRVSPSFILQSFRLGADGVLVTGCHPGDCHYISGNEGAVDVAEMSKNLMEILGIGAERLKLEWISASEGTKFAGLVTEFTNQIKEMGPNPLGVSK